VAFVKRSKVFIWPPKSAKTKPIINEERIHSNPLFPKGRKPIIFPTTVEPLNGGLTGAVVKSGNRLAGERVFIALCGTALI